MSTIYVENFMLVSKTAQGWYYGVCRSTISLMCYKPALLAKISGIILGIMGIFSKAYYYYYYWIIGTGKTRPYKTNLNTLITKITTLITD